MTLLFPGLFIVPSWVLSQKLDSARLEKRKQYIESMNKYLALKLSVDNAVEQLSVDDGVQKFIFSPNTSTNMRINLNYKLLTFSYGFAPKFIHGNDDTEEKGKTKNHSLGFGINVGKFFNQLSYSRIKGYYLANTDEHNPAWKPGDPYLTAPFLDYASFEGLTGYNFNPNYSQAALVSQTERQLKSAGSFIPKLYYRYFVADNKDTATNRPTQKSNNFQVLLGAGYVHSFVIQKKLYFTVGFTPSAGYIWTKLTTRYLTGPEVTHQKNWVLQWTARAGVGYNSEHFFTGLYADAIENSYRQQHTVAVNDDIKLYYQLFVGYRFKAPKFLSSNYEKVEKKVSREIKKLEGKPVD